MMKRSRMGLVLAVAFIGMTVAAVYTARLIFASSIPESRELEGVVDSFDLASTPPMLSLRTEKGIEVISLDPEETTILIGGKTAPLSELVAGQRVKALYRLKEGKGVATSIVVKTPPLSFPPPTARPMER